jgi:hypothetical protein
VPAAGATYLVGKDLEMSNPALDKLERVEHLLQESINGSGNARFWPGQPGDFKNQHLLPRQQVSKNHIIDGPPCTYISLYLLICTYMKPKRSTSTYLTQKTSLLKDLDFGEKGKST